MHYSRHAIPVNPNHHRARGCGSHLVGDRANTHGRHDSKDHPRRSRGLRMPMAAQFPVRRCWLPLTANAAQVTTGGHFLSDIFTPAGFFNSCVGGAMCSAAGCPQAQRVPGLLSCLRISTLPHPPVTTSSPRHPSSASPAAISDFPRRARTASTASPAASATPTPTYTRGTPVSHPRLRALSSDCQPPYP